MLSRRFLGTLAVFWALLSPSTTAADDDVKIWLTGRTLAEGRVKADPPSAPAPTPARAAAVTEPASGSPFANEELTSIPEDQDDQDGSDPDRSERAADAQYAISLLAETFPDADASAGTPITKAVPSLQQPMPDAWARVIATARDERERAMLAILLVGAKRIERVYGIPQAATVAMALHESNYGRSQLTTSAHNWFGLKARKTETAVEMPTRELGKMVRARFRAFEDTLAGLDGFGKFVTRPHFLAALAMRSNPRAYIEAVLRAGYCPEPDYLQCIDTIAARHHLWSLGTPALATTAAR